MASDYNKTLNLPKTKFSMKAGLPKKEPQILKNWEDDKIYEQLIEKNEGKPTFVLHDGPPYANGDIHLGTALNKILKDFIVRYKNMSGFKAPFVPGWDTHGLPTELKARAKAGVSESNDISDVGLRKICREFVTEYIDGQRNQFKALGAIGEWNNPYITLLKEFEGKQIEIFADMVDKGYIYKGLKPVYWCPECKTALAEAEIEYSEDKCKSIYVKFEVSADKAKFRAKGAVLNKTYFVIWTTTSWTLPANVAICLGPDFSYALVKCDDEFYVMAEDLCEKCMKDAGKENYKIIATFKGSDLEYMKVKHPFLNRESTVILGDHVTLESGTGCVHTAPGHGIEDFDVCRNYPELDIVVPVDENGVLTSEAGRFAGLTTLKANKEIEDYLSEINALFAIKDIIHQYPHCWRCKKPVLFRATDQWFCSIDDFKDKALQAIKDVKWLPKWGEDRISSMVSERKDWCISRQRKWGVPIPIFYCEKCGEPLLDKEIILEVSKLFYAEGSDAWFEKSAEEILPKGTKCKKCSCDKFHKEKDIMDVWFDSGVTHAAVCDSRPYLKWPADLYLEGADQYRGWFQSSLLTAVATKGKAPYKMVISHGWVVDGKGRKQSKSLGNGIDPKDVINKYGADILRLWVASSDYHADVRISDEILKQLSEAYRKIRNTSRYILGNLYDFVPDKDMLSFDELYPLDKWALSRLDDLNKKVIKAYDEFEFHQVYRNIYNFCVTDMSNFYLDIIKDRLYVENANGKKRRAAQTTIYTILQAMTLLISPILAYTSEEIWQELPESTGKNKDHVLLNDMPNLTDVKIDKECMEYWDCLKTLREDIQKHLEAARSEKIIGSPLDSKVTIYSDDKNYDFMVSAKENLKEILIVSKVEILKKQEEQIDNLEKTKGIYVEISKADGQKCERCWTYSDTVGKDEEHKTLCERCCLVLKEQQI